MLATKTALMANWMASTFQPMRIKIPLSKILFNRPRIIYDNKLFSLFLDFDINKNADIVIYENKINDKHNTLHYKMMRNYINQNQQGSATLSIGWSADFDHLVISTNGLIPARWLLMAIDFTPLGKMGAVIEPYSENELVEFEQRIIRNLKRVGDVDKIFNRIYNKVYDPDLKLKFQVVQSPDYSKYASDETVISRLPQCYSMSEEDISKQLVLRKWLCYKNHFSVPASIFMSRSGKYRSLQYFNQRDMKWVSSGGYGTIMDTALYFPMNCIMYQPWYRFVRAWDLSLLRIPSSGNEDTYENNETVNYEEMVVLEEILLAEGAEIKEILD